MLLWNFSCLNMIGFLTNVHTSNFLVCLPSLIKKIHKYSSLVIVCNWFVVNSWFITIHFLFILILRRISKKFFGWWTFGSLHRNFFEINPQKGINRGRTSLLLVCSTLVLGTIIAWFRYEILSTIVLFFSYFHAFCHNKILLILYCA